MQTMERLRVVAQESETPWTARPDEGALFPETLRGIALRLLRGLNSAQAVP